MAQLFVQTVPRHAGWLLVGPPSATALMAQQDVTVTFTDGTSVVIPAGIAAALLGGGTTWDRTKEVVVGYVLKGSGTLLAAKESALSAVGGDYAPLVRVLADSVQVYQPQTSLAAGGTLGGGGAALLVVSDTTNKAMSLWNGTSNNAPPANWTQLSYDDSGWAFAALSPTETVQGFTPIGGSHIIWGATPHSGTEQDLFRKTFVLPEGAITSAVLDILGDQTLLGAYVNGTLVGSTGAIAWPTPPPPFVTFTLDPTLLVPGAANVLAAQVQNDASDASGGLTYVLTINGSTPVGFADPSSAEGDLLYRHNGALRRLPLGAANTVLQSNGTDPLWGAAPTGGGAVTKLDEVVVGAGGQATIPFTAINQGYRSLELHFVGASDQSVTTETCRLQFNGDTGANYDWEGVYSAGGAAGAENQNAQTGCVIGALPGTLAPPGGFLGLRLLIPNYTGTTFRKGYVGQSVRETSTTSGFNEALGGVWRSTAAITSILLFPESGNFVAGSVASLYGIL